MIDNMILCVVYLPILIKIVGHGQWFRGGSSQFQAIQYNTEI